MTSPKSWEREFETQMETSKFPVKTDFNFHWKSSSLQTETSDLRPDFLFSWRTINWMDPLKPGRPLPLEI